MKKAEPKDQKPGVKSLFQTPGALFYAQPLICIQMGGAVEVEGCGQIVDFEAGSLQVQVGDRLVKFYGDDLRIEAFGRKRMRIAGKLVRIEFEADREKR